MPSQNYLSPDDAQKLGAYWAKDVSQHLMGKRHYSVPYLRGEVQELVDAVKERSWPHTKEEMGDVAFGAQMIAHQRTGLNFPMVGADAVIKKFYDRVEVYKKMFADRGVPFHVDHLAGGSNYQKPEKIVKAFASAGHPMSIEEAVQARESALKQLPHIKVADHVQDRRAERAPLITPRYVEAVRKAARRLQVPEGTYHFPLIAGAHGINGIGVFRVIDGKLTMTTILPRTAKGPGQHLEAAKLFPQLAEKPLSDVKVASMEKEAVGARQRERIVAAVKKMEEIHGQQGYNPRNTKKLFGLPWSEYVGEQFRQNFMPATHSAVIATPGSWKRKNTPAMSAYINRAAKDKFMKDRAEALLHSGVHDKSKIRDLPEVSDPRKALGSPGVKPGRIAWKGTGPKVNEIPATEPIWWSGLPSVARQYSQAPTSLAAGGGRLYAIDLHSIPRDRLNVTTPHIALPPQDSRWSDHADALRKRAKRVAWLKGDLERTLGVPKFKRRIGISPFFERVIPRDALPADIHGNALARYKVLRTGKLLHEAGVDVLGGAELPPSPRRAAVKSAADYDPEEYRAKLRHQQWSGLKRRFERYKRDLKNDGVYTGTYHTRIPIPKSELTEDHIRALGFLPDAGIPEKGQDRFLTYRHPDHNFHLHSHPGVWTMHEDDHAAVKMKLHKAKTLADKLKAVVGGVPHFVLEGVPGAAIYLKNQASQLLTGEERTMVDAIKEERDLMGLKTKTASIKLAKPRWAKEIEKGLRDSELALTRGDTVVRPDDHVAYARSILDRMPGKVSPREIRSLGEGADAEAILYAGDSPIMGRSLHVVKAMTPQDEATMRRNLEERALVAETLGPLGAHTPADGHIYGKGRRLVGGISHQEYLPFKGRPEGVAQAVKDRVGDGSPSSFLKPRYVPGYSMWDVADHTENVRRRTQDGPDLVIDAHYNKGGRSGRPATKVHGTVESRRISARREAADLMRNIDKASFPNYPYAQHAHVPQVPRLGRLSQQARRGLVAAAAATAAAGAGTGIYALANHLRVPAAEDV